MKDFLNKLKDLLARQSTLTSEEDEIVNDFYADNITEEKALDMADEIECKSDELEYCLDVVPELIKEWHELSSCEQEIADDFYGEFINLDEAFLKAKELE